MSRVPDPHLSSDDIDAWLAGRLPVEQRLHLDGCPVCLERAHGEREIIRQLQALPRLAPAATFEDRVMTRVRIRRRRFATRTALALAASVTVVLLGGIAGSVAWSLAHPGALAALGGWLWAEGSQLLWSGLRDVASGLVEQPWYGAVRGWLATPGRIALVAGLATLGYLGGVLALRRLMTAPTPRVADAGA